ncbi:MAG: glycosyltransferase [Anaerolineales bacterium]|nr:glycosyltransferase [Anaerolineales bacterium]
MRFLPTVSVLASVYKGEEYLPGFFDNLQTQTIFPEIELVLVLNEPSTKEKRLCRDFSARHAKQVQVLQAPRLETLGASWNRAWRAAQAPYLAPWNVDDRRTVDSLQRQMVAMESEPDAVLCYGDYLTVAHYGSEEGPRRHTPEYSIRHFRRALAQGGAFWMLRAAVSEQAGYYDEQFRVAADMDYSLRLAVMGLPILRAEGLLGYFTDAGQGLSTRQDNRPLVERTVVYLRYGVFDKIQKQFLKPAEQYRQSFFKNAGEWIPVEQILPEYAAYLQRRQALRWLGSFRFIMKSFLKRLGLLDWLHAMQEKHLRREI